MRGKELDRRPGDVLAEIETDKATMEFEAVDDGRLGRILVPEGAEGIKVNQPIALLLGEGEDPLALDKLGEKPATPIAAASAPEPLRAAEPRQPGCDADYEKSDHEKRDPQDGDRAEIAAFVEIVNQYADHLGLRGEQHDRR